MLKKSLLSVVAVCFVTMFSSVWAGYQFYGASLDEATWRSSGNRIECRLSQEIPGYGTASFRHRALHAIDFRIASNLRLKMPVRL